MKISSNTYYIRHENEISRYISENKNWVHVIKSNNNYINITKHKENILMSEGIDNFKEEFINLKDGHYDLIVVTDILELTDDVYGLLKTLNHKLSKGGKVLITTINPKWNSIMLFFEFLRLKKTSLPRSYIHNKKIKSIAASAGFNVIESHNRQIFPFKLLRVGSFINLLFELLFFKFNFGINNYLLLSKSYEKSTGYSKSIIIPAKNEELNLLPLFNRIPKFDSQYEVIFVIAESEDDTLQVANKIKNDNKSINIEVIQQESKGKGPGVLEAFNISSHDLIAILDSDISVDPETLLDFFEIIESGNADFVNGTRFVYKMQEGAMRKLNNLGNIFFQFIISLVISNNLTDSLCGTKVFKKELLLNLHRWKGLLFIKDPFGDFDLIFSAAYSGNKIVEYPVHYKSRVYGATQISRFSDGFKLLAYFFNSLFVFNSSNNDNT